MGSGRLRDQRGRHAHRHRHRGLAGPRPRPRRRPRRPRLAARHRRPRRRRARAGRRRLRDRTEVVAIAGDVGDPWHRRGARRRGGPRIDLLVNNASTLGPSPLPPLALYPLDELEQVYRINVLAPLALVQAALPRLAEGARIINVTSDAAVEPYEGWGGYGVLEGGARAAHRGLRRGEAGAARLRRRPGRHEHAHAPGRVPGRGHLGPAAAGGRACPGCSR